MRKALLLALLLVVLANLPHELQVATATALITVLVVLAALWLIGRRVVGAISGVGRVHQGQR